VTARLDALCFDARDPRRLARFWAGALGWQIDDDTSGVTRLVPTDGTRFFIDFLRRSRTSAGRIASTST